MAHTGTRVRTGGHVVVEALQACGIEAVFGLPGIHALAIWEGLRAHQDIRYVGLRSELAAGFAADGYARSTGRTGVLVTTTGPGSFVAACALMEARSSHVPLVNIVPQVPRALIDQDRGFLHELRRQSDVFAPLVKRVLRAQTAESIPYVLCEAFRLAQTAPTGPVLVEIPVDVLEGTTGLTTPTHLDVAPPPALAAAGDDLARAVALLDGAARPLLWAGSGVLRGAAWTELRLLAERLDAPVATSYSGRGAFPDDHPLAVGAPLDERAFKELAEAADCVLAIGTELGAETTGQWTLELPAALIQLDVRGEHIGAQYPAAVALVGDARPTLAALVAGTAAARRDGAARAAHVREQVQGSRRETFATELGLLDELRRQLPATAVTAFDMTILGYWAAAFFRVTRPRSFLYPLGSGTLGYAWPAALGARVGNPEAPCVAVHGDGGFLYATQELASARQHGIDAKLVLVDDSTYGILDAYQQSTYGASYAVELVQPDFTALAGAYGVHCVPTDVDGFAAALAEALAHDGPAVVHLKTRLRSY